MLNIDMVMVPREILKRSMDLLGCVGCSPEGAESDARDAARLQEDIKPYVAATQSAADNAALRKINAALCAKSNSYVIWNASLEDRVKVLEDALRDIAYITDGTDCNAHAAAVTAAKDAEIAALQIKADLLDLAVRKGLLSVHSELIDPRNHGTRCSWLEGHAKACDISNNACAALGEIK